MLLSAIAITISSFLICFYTIPILIKLSNRFGIYDLPNHIKKHDRRVSFFGGVALMLSFLIPISLLAPAYIKKPVYLNAYLILMMVMFLHGLGDDFFNYTPKRKFLIQAILSALLIYKSEFYIPFEQLFGFELPSLVYITITLLISIAIVNAFNLIDGSDGLAGSISLIASLFYAAYFYIDQNYFFFIVALCIAGSLFGFLLYNKPPAHIFMGDSGALFIGMLLATFSFVFIENKAGLNTMSTSNRIILSYSFLSIPIMDMIRLFIFRIYEKKNPFKGDNNHIHHLMATIGFTPKQSVLIIITFQLLNIGIAFLSLDRSWLGYILISTCGYIFLIQVLRQLKTYLKQIGVKSINPNQQEVENIPTIDRYKKTGSTQ